MSQPRAQATVVLTMPTPAIVNGKPVTPAYWAKNASSATVKIGPHHTRPVDEPDTKKYGKGYKIGPPPLTGKWHARWSARNLPHPADYPNGFYWLGAPTSADGSSSYHNTATHQWDPVDDSDKGAPAWQSFYPFKPSVTAIDHYLQGGGVVHHAQGVNFNSHFVEHMWLDWRRDHPQPFTWVIAACVAAWPSPHYTHYLLDSGRNPSAVHFPHLSADQAGVAHTIHDGLDYRNLMAINHRELTTTSRLQQVGGHSVFARTSAGLRPRMYVGIFDGTHSYAGVYAPERKVLRRGSLDNTSAQKHRFYVMGRANGSISPSRSSHLLVFEVRYWQRHLTSDQLEEQYGQLSSVWKFNSYRGL